MITPQQPTPRRQFASDNWSGICPEALDALMAANAGHVPSYGDDEWTARAADAIREFFETDCDVYFTFNGTAANSLAIATLCHSYHSVLCHELAHIETDECGAPEFFSGGTKILLVGGANGKIDLDQIEHQITRRSDIHYPKPRVISLAQSTEVGTVYTLGELQAIRAMAKEHGLRVHMDGARIANAIAALNCTPRAITRDADVDVVCMGGTKAGLPVGDAVVFFRRDLSEEFAYRCKQAGQLASKMRFLSAPWLGLLETGAYLRYAAHANACAKRLADKLAELEGVSLQSPAEANAVFLNLPKGIPEKLKALGWHFYTFIGDGGARFMTTWDTTDDDIDALVADVARFVDRAVSPGGPARPS